MDTKLTRIQNNKILKSILIILSCIAVFISAIYAQKTYSVLRSNYNNFYGQYPFFDIETKNTILGNGFTIYCKMINEDTQAALSLATIYKSDEAVADGSAFEHKEQEIRREYAALIKENIINAKLNAIEGMYVYNYDKERYEYPNASIEQDLILSDFSSQNQIDADVNAQEYSKAYNGRGLTVIKGKRYYKGYPIDEVKVNEKKIEASQTAEMEREILTEKARFTSKYEKTKKDLNALKNFEYCIKDKNTGVVYTNMKLSGINSPEFSVDTACNNMKDYAVKLTDGDLRISDEIFQAANMENFQYIDYGAYDKYESLAVRNSHLIDYIEFLGVQPKNAFDADNYDVYIHVKTSDIIQGDRYEQEYNRFVVASENGQKYLNTMIAFAVIWLVLVIVLAIISGSYDKDGNLKLTFIDKVPNSLHLLVSGAATVGLFVLTYFIFYDDSLGQAAYNYSDSIRAVASLMIVLANLFFVEWLMSFTRQIRAHTLFSNSIINRVIIKNVKKFKLWWHSEDNKVMSKVIKERVFLPLIISFVVCFAFMAIMVLLIIYYNTWELYTVAIVAIIVSLIILIFAIKYLIKLTAGLDNIKAALLEADNGKFDYKVNLQRMPIALKPLANSTNNLTDGIKVAVDEAVRGERMKAELITNVSHDLKTPLTSIITYTDLLTKCDIKDKKALEYIDVLVDKSGRLRHLIDDLVEASKASTGNVTLNISEINMNEMVEQIFGENEDALKALNLDLKIDLEKDPVYVKVDGQKTYRIIDNLFSNVKKYAMPGTRVYIDLKKDKEYALVSIKNISKDEMNFDATNLAERFVRGDESRTTEGSGLGLSIAKSLTELQKGVFEISTDGDLFKVVIKLPLSKI